MIEVLVFCIAKHVSGFWHIHAKTPRGIVADVYGVSFVDYRLYE